MIDDGYCRHRIYVQKNFTYLNKKIKKQKIIILYRSQQMLYCYSQQLVNDTIYKFMLFILIIIVVVT